MALKKPSDSGCEYADSTREAPRNLIRGASVHTPGEGAISVYWSFTLDTVDFAAHPRDCWHETVDFFLRHPRHSLRCALAVRRLLLRGHFLSTSSAIR